MMIYHLVILFVVMTQSGNYPSKKLSHGINYPVAIIAIIPAALNGVLITYLWPIMKLEHILPAQKLQELGLYGSLWILFIPYYVLVTPWLEELFWRGIFGSNKKTPDVSDILFAGYHIPVLILFIKPFWTIVIFAILTLTAWMWRLIKIKFNGLFIPLLSHFAADISTVIALYKISL
ncbi:hypothetical protein JXQ31_03910 [candidate division KSB1 bacterium]|nr:hypothetical protein [candidate division KSB1 bacterium]